MTEEKAKITAIGEAARADFSTHRVGEIAAIDEEGRAHVTFPGNHGVPVRARSVVDAPARAGEHPQALVGARVLLAFENGDPNLPIVVGLVREELRPEPVRPEVSLDLGTDRDVVVDGQRLVFDAGQEVLLRCGKSSVLLRRDGKVLIRGTHLVSRASGPNRIKGGSISLN
jgi:hypothetical protein